MPELPEVEIYARYFTRHALGQPISGIDVRDERILGKVRKREFVESLVGKTFNRVRRHGKNFFAEAGAAQPAWLYLHFGMTGDLVYYRKATERPQFARVVFDFDNGAHLAYDDMRLFGVVDLVTDPDAFIAERRLGPDPLTDSFRLRDFQRIVERRRGAVKSLLMSQDIIAGIGNLYADEALYQTSIHPQRGVDRLSSAEVKALFTAVRRILRETILRAERGLDRPPRYLIHRREEGKRCPLCGGTIRRTVVFGRTTYYCGKHQR